MFLKAHSLQEAGTDIRAPLFIFLFLSFSSRLKWLKIALQTLDLTEEGAGEKKKNMVVGWGGWGAEHGCFCAAKLFCEVLYCGYTSLHICTSP